MRKEVFQMDEKKEKKSMKNNLEYFWMYYKLPFIAGMIVVILAMYSDYNTDHKRYSIICNADRLSHGNER